MSIDDQLRRNDPARDLDVSDDSLAWMLRAATQTPAPRRAPRRRVWLAAGLVAALALTAASPAIADGVRYLAQTGWFGNPNPSGVGGPFDAGDSTEQDDSEWIDIMSDDYVDYAASVFPAYISLPAQYDEDAFARATSVWRQNNVRDSLDGAPGASMQNTGIVRGFETDARCAWIKEWNDAPDGSARQDAAIEVLLEAAHWDATVATDGGGIVDMYVTQAEDARDGKVGRISMEECTGLVDAGVLQ